MASNEFSHRHPVPDKKYKGVLQQQGRVELDGDRNDGVVLKGELRNLIETIKPKVALSKSIKGKKGAKGYRAIFQGTAGTGKGSAAELIARELKKELYKVNLSMIVSKYIGETEKNLEQVFERAEDKGWILFFDEADALFGKRTDVRDSHDKYANQEIAYLLQRIEKYDGIVILAVNTTIDKAVTDCFHSIIKFPI